MTASRALARRLTSSILAPAASLLVVLLGWEVLVDTSHLPSYVFPSPMLVLGEMVDNAGLLLSELAVTIAAATAGFLIALVLAVTAGALIAASRMLDRALTPWLVVAHAVPKVVIAPLFLVWFGFGLKSEIFFVVTFTFFPMVVNTVAGLRSADPDLVELVRSMGASQWQVLRKIRFPAALPSIFSGIKISITLAPVGAVIGEFVASNRGLGHLLIQSVGDMETPLAFAAVTVFSIFGIAVWKFAEWLERRALPWHASERERRRTLEQAAA